MDGWIFGGSLGREGGGRGDFEREMEKMGREAEGDEKEMGWGSYHTIILNKFLHFRRRFVVSPSRRFFILSQIQNVFLFFFFPVRFASSSLIIRHNLSLSIRTPSLRHCFIVVLFPFFFSFVFHQHQKLPSHLTRVFR